MGGRLGTPGAVGFLYMFVQIRISHSWIKKYILEYIARLKYVNRTTQNLVVQCLPAEIAILKVKQHRGWILLGWEAAWERRVLLEFLHLLKGKIFCYTFQSSWPSGPRRQT